MERPGISQEADGKRGLLAALVGDGRPLLTFSGLSLTISGGFALFLAATGHFLPHDARFLGMSAGELCAIQDCRILRFMIHDRVAFGGALIAIGVLYLWLATFPLRRGQVWSWWVFLISGLLGFGSFLAYLGYGYLDSWHGVATLILLPLFVSGLILTYRTLPDPRGIAAVLQPAMPLSWDTPFAVGRLFLLLTTAGMMAGGLTILIVGTTVVFVPQDLHFMGLVPGDLDAINPRLIPLIAHDRAGFGGAILTTGLAGFFSVWCARPSRGLWQALLLSGTAGFAAAIGIHPIVSYNDLFHLAPAILGATIFAMGLVLTRPMAMSGQPGV